MYNLKFYLQLYIILIFINRLNQIKVFTIYLIVDIFIVQNKQKAPEGAFCV